MSEDGIMNADADLTSGQRLRRWAMVPYGLWAAAADAALNSWRLWIPR